MKFLIASVISIIASAPVFAVAAGSEILSGDVATADPNLRPRGAHLTLRSVLQLAQKKYSRIVSASDFEATRFSYACQNTTCEWSILYVGKYFTRDGETTRPSITPVFIINDRTQRVHFFPPLFPESPPADDPEMVFWARPKPMHLMSTAKEVYIFQVATPLNPHPGKPLRLLDPGARDALEHVLGDEQDWFHGLDDRIRVGEEPKNIGLVFRQGSDELTLFFASGGSVKAAFNGKSSGGWLKDKASAEMEKWKSEYAKPELATK